MFAHLRELAVAQRLDRRRAVVPRRGDVRPLRAGAGRLDPLALGVPDAVHALPARGLPGHAAGDVRVPDGDQRADRPARLERDALRGPERARRRRVPRATSTTSARASWSRAACTRTRARRCATTSAGWGTTVEEIPLRDGVTDADALQEALGDDVSRRLPRDSRTSSARSRTSRRSCRPPRRPARSPSCQCDPMTLGVLRPPGDFGVDIAVGEGQPLGNRLDYGGPSFGFFAAQQAYLRRMPGRIAGETTDVDGRRGFVLTLQTREQHIRREKATTNISTAQTLNALAGDRLPELARPPRDRRARRADAPAHRLRARARWPRSTASSRCTSSRSCASSPCAGRPTSTA